MTKGWKRDDVAWPWTWTDTEERGRGHQTVSGDQTSGYVGHVAAAFKQILKIIVVMNDCTGEEI